MVDAYDRCNNNHNAKQYGNEQVANKCAIRLPIFKVFGNTPVDDTHINERLAFLPQLWLLFWSFY